MSEDIISTSRANSSKYIVRIKKSQLYKKIINRLQKFNFRSSGKIVFKESAIILIVGFYFLWVFNNSFAYKKFVKDPSSSESEQYLSSSYTYIDATVLTGEVQKETYSEYIIGEKETLSEVAKNNNLHVASILEANNISPSNADLVTPGTKILIPTEDISASNEWIVASNVRIEKEKAEAEKKRQEELKKKKLALNNSRNVITRSTSGKSVGKNTGTNLYPWGYCTWYVASRRNVPRWGNAGSWLSNARASGYATGSEARPGAIFVSTESSVGHVGIVESVNGGMMTISEMNYGGRGKYNTRTIPVNASQIRGFIY